MLLQITWVPDDLLYSLSLSLCVCAVAPYSPWFESNVAAIIKRTWLRASQGPQGLFNAEITRQEINLKQLFIIIIKSNVWWIIL